MRQPLGPEFDVRYPVVTNRTPPIDPPSWTILQNRIDQQVNIHNAAEVCLFFRAHFAYLL